MSKFRKVIMVMVLLFISISTVAQSRKKDTVAVFLLLTDTTMHPLKISIERCYSIREWHNEGEGVIDWYFSNKRPPKDYPVHIYFLDSKKVRLKNKLIWEPNQQ